MAIRLELATLDGPPRTHARADLHGEHDAWLALMAGDNPDTFMFLNRETAITPMGHTMWMTPHDEGD